jgi:hypothetical protein
MPRAALLLALFLPLAACAQAPAPAIPRAPAQPGNPATNPAVVAACRDEVSRQLVRQDRGQLLREEERDARLGSDVTGARLPIDPLGRSTQFTRMVDQCVRANTVPAGSTVPGGRPGS